ncbi:MAG: hypothetical protein VXY92_14345 [Planctomycetota bacterium]|nr:hypothetical protein [Planctomycetota bacterium]
MKIRIASTLLALALPLVAQDAPASQVEAVFYKAYDLEKGQRDFAGAMTLYQEFLEKAPTHKLAAEAAKQQFRLLDRTGKTKERDAFQAKYKDLIGTMVAGGTRPTRPERGERPEGGRGERGGRGGWGGRGGMGGVMRLMRGDAKVSEMSEEEIEGLKEGIGAAEGMIDRMREMMGDEIADKLTKASDDLKKALDAGKMHHADKALEALQEAFPMGRSRGGRGGDQGGRRRGRGGEEGGRGREGRGGEGRGGEGRGGEGRGGEGRGGN